MGNPNSIYTDFTDFPYEVLKICVEIPCLGLAQKLCEHFPEPDSQRFSDGVAAYLEKWII